MKELMSFSGALKALKDGHLLQRIVWQGDQKYIFLVKGSNFKVNRPPLLGIYPEGTPVTYNSHIDICNTDGSVNPWEVTHEDLLAIDWFILDSKVNSYE